MPIKDISKEEQANLYLPRQPKRETLQLTEVDRGTDIKNKTFMGVFLSFSQLQHKPALVFL